MNIVYFCDEYPPRPHGGIGTFVESMAQGMLHRGHRVTVVGLGNHNEQTDAGGVTVITRTRNDIKRVGNLITRIQLRNYLASLVKAGQADIIEVPDYMGMLPFGVPGAEVVVRLHLSSTAIRFHAQMPASKGIAFYEKRTLAATPHWIAVSNSVLALTKATFSISARHSKVIYNPAPSAAGVPELRGLPEKFILFAGQVSKRKGALIAAEAAQDLMTKRSDLHLVYAGGPSPNESERSLPEEILRRFVPDTAQRVHFLGHVSREKVLACMKRASVFVFPSSLEALGLVVLEAMGCGVPVVCTNIPPGPEMVDDGVNGILADPNSAEDFRNGLARILDDPGLARELTENARRTLAERFSLDACLTETEEFYQECISQT
jgi:glycosyltransferase involved in cell wall biosynthesis